MSAAATKAEAIAQANDEARKNVLNPEFCTISLTQGVAFLQRQEKIEIIEIIQNYQNWTRGNDTYAERDFGVIYKVRGHWTQEPQSDSFKGKTLFFKFSYYDKSDMNYGSEHPEDTALTTRVLTIMFAEEY